MLGPVPSGNAGAFTAKGPGVRLREQGTGPRQALSLLGALLSAVISAPNPTVPESPRVLRCITAEETRPPTPRCTSFQALSVCAHVGSHGLAACFRRPSCLCHHIPS